MLKLRSAICVALTCWQLCAFSQHQIAVKSLQGKYAFYSGGAVQFAADDQQLLLITPGNPVQEMEPVGRNAYRSKTLGQEQFVFSEDNTDSIRLEVVTTQGSIRGVKVSDEVEDHSSAMDSLLPRRKSSEHFAFWFSDTDTVAVDSVAHYLEAQHARILRDFKLSSLPVTAVKMYPDLKSFHLAINEPDAPAEILATAFGRNEFRMVSPSKGGPELMQFISHEFTHCVHLNIDYSPNNPRWLWEGVAMYESGWFMDPAQIDQIKNRNFPALQELGNGMEYALGYVIIEAIKDMWGFDAVIGLIKNRGNVEKVLSISGVKFEQDIFEHIYKKYVNSASNLQHTK
jgi:hypothetical protein